MWLMTTIGFFSAVADRDDPEGVLVRARCEEDIRNLSELVHADYQFTVDADYPYRLRCSRDVWADTIRDLALGIDYPNFKGAIGHGPHGEAYHEVWAQMHLIDPREDRRRAILGT